MKSFKLSGTGMLLEILHLLFNKLTTIFQLQGCQQNKTKQNLKSFFSTVGPGFKDFKFFM